MKKAIVLVVLLALAGGAAVAAHVVHKAMTVSFEVSPDAPLGRFDALDRHLTGKGLERRPAPGGGFEYTDRKWTDERRWPHVVTVVADTQGRVLQVSGTCMTIYDRPDSGATAVPKFLKAYWREVAGSERNPQQVSSGIREQTLATEALYATWTTKKHSGYEEWGYDEVTAAWTRGGR